MKRQLTYICFAALMAAGLGVAKDRKGVLTGTWDCQSHGGNLGEAAFTLYLQQNSQDKEVVDGTIASPLGGTQISSGTFRRNMLEIHVDTPQGGYILMAKFERGKLSGNWATESDKGTWDGSKHAEAAK